MTRFCLTAVTFYLMSLFFIGCSVQENAPIQMICTSENNQNYKEKLLITNNGFVEIRMLFSGSDINDIRHGTAKVLENSIELNLIEIPGYYGVCEGVINMNNGQYKRSCVSKSKTTQVETIKKSILFCYEEEI